MEKEKENNGPAVAGRTHKPTHRALLTSTGYKMLVDIVIHIVYDKYSEF